MTIAALVGLFEPLTSQAATTMSIVAFQRITANNDLVPAIAKAEPLNSAAPIIFGPANYQ